MFVLIAPLVFIGVFSLPMLVLELQLLAIGVSFVTINTMIITLVIGLLSMIGAWLIELFDY